MMAVHKIRDAKFRESLADSVLEVLAYLPETQRKIYVWNHYCGYQSGQIAVNLGCGLSEVETTLEMINWIIYKKAHALLAAESTSRKKLQG